MKPLVLVVDDEISIRELCRINLELGGYRVTEAPGGAEAIERLDDDDIDVVVLDVMMPETNGWDVLDHLASCPTAPPVVMLSAATGSDDPARARDAGAAFIGKPFHPQALVDAVADALRT